MNLLLALTLILAQPLPKKEPPAEPSTLGPEGTAFPDLKVPTVPGGGRTYEQYAKERGGAIARALDVLPALPKDATLLQKVQYEQAGEARRYLRRTEETISIGRWDGSMFRDYLTTASEFCRTAAELHAAPADRVRCHESRVVLLKVFEQFIETRVNVGSEPPQNLNLVRSERLKAEADLLKLKAEIEKGETGNCPSGVNRTACPLPGRAPILFRRRL